MLARRPGSALRLLAILPGMTRSMFVLLALSSLVLLSPTGVEARYRDLCMSVPFMCEYTGPDAPLLQANVCYGSAIGVRLMTGSCPSGSWPYYVEHGEVVDPITNQVAAYVSLYDACTKANLCVAGPPPPGAEAFPMCCKKNAQGGETCYDGGGCGGTMWWCNDGVCNEDGTVTCFNADGF